MNCCKPSLYCRFVFVCLFLPNAIDLRSAFPCFVLFKSDPLRVAAGINSTCLLLYEYVVLRSENTLDKHPGIVLFVHGPTITLVIGYCWPMEDGLTTLSQRAFAGIICRTTPDAVSLSWRCLCNNTAWRKLCCKLLPSLQSTFKEGYKDLLQMREGITKMSYTVH